MSGADPEIEEGGGHTYRVGIGAARASPVPRPSRIRRLQYVAQKPENDATYIEHAQSCRGVWEHATPGKF